MKKLLILLLMFNTVEGQRINNKPLTGQVKKKAQIKHRDSTYYESTCDTTFGMITYNVGNGTVNGEGMIVRWINMKWTVQIPAPLPEYHIKGKDTIGIFAFASGMGHQINDYTRGYILTLNGYKEVDEKYIFVPSVK